MFICFGEKNTTLIHMENKSTKDTTVIFLWDGMEVTIHSTNICVKDVVYNILDKNNIKYNLTENNELRTSLNQSTN